MKAEEYGYSNYVKEKGLCWIASIAGLVISTGSMLYHAAMRDGDGFGASAMCWAGSFANIIAQTGKFIAALAGAGFHVKRQYTIIKDKIELVPIESPAITLFSGLPLTAVKDIKTRSQNRVIKSVSTIFETYLYMTIFGKIKKITTNNPNRLGDPDLFQEDPTCETTLAQELSCNELPTNSPVQDENETLFFNGTSE